MKHTLTLLTALLLAPPAHALEETIPFPAALDAAAIRQERLDSIMDNSLILGNGDVNALVWTEQGALMLILTKNDVWDARLYIAKDQPLPTLARIKEL